MGQYFNATSYSLVNNKKVNIENLESWDYENGSKLMEHSWVGNNYVNMVEKLICSTGRWYGKRIVWAGDYEEVEENEKVLCSIGEKIKPEQYKHIRFRFLTNLDKGLYVDLKKVPLSKNGFQIHPLPLLTSNSNGNGMGDFYGSGNKDIIGSWSGDVITTSTRKLKIKGLKELIFDLSE